MQCQGTAQFLEHEVQVWRSPAIQLQFSTHSWTPSGIYHASPVDEICVEYVRMKGVGSKQNDRGEIQALVSAEAFLLYTSLLSVISMSIRLYD